MKAYPTLKNMGLCFGFGIRTVSDYLERIKIDFGSSTINSHLKDLI